MVVHTPLDALLDEEGETSELAGDLERDGLISTETVRRIACDATIAIGVDDDVGHTMYEGRARRDTPQRPNGARSCAGTAIAASRAAPTSPSPTSTMCVPWKPGGTTDLHNLALLCLHHHHLVHSRGWTMTGNANEELTFLGPSGRVMTSRPSPRWTAVPAGSRSRQSSSIGAG